MFYAYKGQGNQSATPKFALGVGIAEETVTKSGKCQNADTMPSRTGSSIVKSRSASATLRSLLRSMKCNYSKSRRWDDDFKFVLSNPHRRAGGGNDAKEETRKSCC